MWMAAELTRIRRLLAQYLAESGYPEEREEWDPAPGCEAFVHWIAEQRTGRPRALAGRRRELSEQGRENIRAGQRRRWARTTAPS
jgi:hypothetical protein